MPQALHPLTADSLDGVAHGFFTRGGGVSGGIYASLNNGLGSADDPAAVAANRARVAAHFGAPLVTLHQCHSALALVVRAPITGDLPKADALVTDSRDVTLGALSADCAPILFADRAAGVVGAAHAGWRGALDGVIGATVAAMLGLGARREGIQAVVGPCLSMRNYEVGPEFVERFLEDDPEHARYFASGIGDRAQFDLPGFVLGRLRAEGVAAEWTGHCTYADPERFYSYRRATHAGEPDYGRLVAAIRLTGV